MHTYTHIHTLYTHMFPIFFLPDPAYSTAAGFPFAPPQA